MRSMAAQAPVHLEVVKRFVNTLDIETGADELTDPAALRSWLIAADLLPDLSPALRRRDVAKAVAVREALRAVLLSHHTGEPADPAAVATLNEAATKAPVVVQLESDGAATLEPAGTGIDAAVGRLLGAVHLAIADGSWCRLKACRLESCQWAFFDGSKNRSGSWCSMAVCGNRSKASAYRARQRTSH
jgi:predicted RNA-binding Zn ribbon-like protein